MKRGPKPKPTAIRMFEGNPGKRPINGEEPQPEREIPEPPDHLNDLAREEWERITPQLHAVGLLSRLDRVTLALYCCAWGRWVHAERQLKDGGDMVLSSTGSPVQSPWLAVSNRAQKQLKEYAAVFGMDPSARSTLKVPLKPTTDDLDAFKRSGSLKEFKAS